MARRYQPETKGEIASPLLGFDSFAWGGENVDIFQLDVPSSYLSKPLELVAGENNTYTLYNDDGEILLQGTVGEQVSSSGFTMQVKTLNARPEKRKKKK